MRTALAIAAIIGCLVGVGLNVLAGPPCQRYNYIVSEDETDEEARSGMEQIARVRTWACAHPFLYRALLFSIGLVPCLVLTAVGVGALALVRRAV